MSKFIPLDIANAQKQGFSSPDSSWFKGDSIDYVSKRLMDNNSPVYDLIDQKTLRSLVNEHLKGKLNRRLLVWSFLNLDQILGDSY